MGIRIGSQHGPVTIAIVAAGPLGQRAGLQQAVLLAGEDPLVLVVDRGEILVGEQALDGKKPVAAEVGELFRREATHAESGHSMTLPEGVSTLPEPGADRVARSPGDSVRNVQDQSEEIADLRQGDATDVAAPVVDAPGGDCPDVLALGCGSMI